MKFKVEKGVLYCDDTPVGILEAADGITNYILYAGRNITFRVPERAV